MDVRVDEAGRKNAALGIVDASWRAIGLLVRTRSLDRGNPSAGEPELAVGNFRSL
jgi:hypothetical protein